MPTNINQSDIDRVENTLEIEALKTSRLPDTKNIFKSEEREKAFKKRYGKDIKVTITYEMNGNKLKELTIRFQSVKNKVYSLTEYFTDIETTDYCILCCRRNGRNFEYRFDRFLDAEISLVDMISEE